MIIGNVTGIVAIGRWVYEVALVDEDGQPHVYTFTVEEEPIPVAVWTAAFDEEIGTLTRPGQDIAAAVLAFHRLCRADVPMTVPET